MRKGRERGAIVVEATISLSAFIFMIFTILSIVNICFIQAKIGVALNAAAKEISQYSYLYFAFGMDGMDAKIAEGTQDSKALAMDTVDGVGIFMDSLSQAGQSAQSADFDNMVDSIENGTDSLDSLVTKYSDAIKDDPKGFILGMGKMALVELEGEGKQLLAEVLAKTFMDKNLKSEPGDSSDAFLKRYNVKDGMAGLNFSGTAFLMPEQPNLVQLVVTYDIEVIKLLNIDYSFTICQCAKTAAWGNGISLIDPSSNNIWDLAGLERGKQIVAEEKENYDYVSTGDGYDAYDPEDNEFITITSIDTTLPSNDTADELYRELMKRYNQFKEDVDELGDPIVVENQDGEEVEFDSDPSTREYTMVLVLPDDYDQALVEEALRKFREENPGVTIEIVTGYGDANDSGGSNEGGPAKTEEEAG